MGKKKNGNGNGAISIPPRRMTQAELDGFLEKAANILRGNVDHSEFRGYVFALLFYKRISDCFEEEVRRLEKDLGDEDLARDPSMHHFVVPKECDWETVTGVTSTKLGQSFNDAMLAIERANAPKFDGILTNKIDFNKQDELPRSKLVDLKNHFGSQQFDKAHVPDDLFGDAYEYLIRSFASKAGKSSGEFYTPREVSYLMSEIIDPKEGHEVCDWASGSGSLLLQCREYLRRHGNDPNQLFLFAQESNVATHNISRINLILHGVNSWNPKHGDSLRDPKHRTSDNQLKQFDRIVMNPPFSLESWGYDDFTDGDPFDRFGYAMPPRNNGDYAWMQHVAKSLKPDGKAIIVMSQGILFRGQPQLTEEEDGRNKKADDEFLIRRGFLKDDLIEGIIVLPSGIFYGNNVPACLAIINKRKPKSRKKKVLMIWASRDFKSSNPQNILRRADCLRILVPWKAYGNIEKARKLIGSEGKSFLDAVEQERQRLLDDISQAYDPPLEELPQYCTELATLSNDAFKEWQKNSDPNDATWGKIAEPTNAVNVLAAEIKALPRGDKSKKGLQAKLKDLRADLRKVTKETKDAAKARSKHVKAMIKALEKLEREREERIEEVNAVADRERADISEAIDELKQICAADEAAQRYFFEADIDEIDENEFNLNVPRYVQTFDPEPVLCLDKAVEQLKNAQKTTDATRKKLFKSLGTR